MNYSTYQPRSYKSRKKSHKKRNIIIVVIVLATITSGVLWFTKKDAVAPVQPDNQSGQSGPEAGAPVVAKLTYPNLQPVVDSWVASHPGTYSVKITDPDGNSLAATDDSEQFFTASLYKLFVAYVGYQKIDDGTYSASEPYITGYTRGQCLDAMIRASYSPCGEAWWNELGKQAVTDKMEDLGLTDTDLSGLVTTASDTAIILKKIYSGEGLSAASKAAYLDSMNTQDAVYRRGLPSGFTNATVYNKVGWNLDQEWHDASIVELPNGRKVIVAVLTKNAGYTNISGLGKALQSALQ